jgi:RNA polymerase sigma factor for flagellar operon FliA
MEKKLATSRYESISINKAIFPLDRTEVISKFTPLIRFIAKRIAARLPANVEFDDLLSSGAIGLMDAIDKYDPTRENKFKTYAEFRIRGAILDELRAQDWIPRSVREKAKFIDRTYIRLEKEFGRLPTDDEIASALGLSRDDYFSLLSQVKSVSLLSLDEYTNFTSSDKKSILGLLEDYKATNPYVQLNVSNIKAIITEGIKALPEKERLVLSLYYYEDLNLKEIGDVLSVTESRVSQLHSQAVIRLRSKLKKRLEDGAL